MCMFSSSIMLLLQADPPAETGKGRHYQDDVDWRGACGVSLSLAALNPTTFVEPPRCDQTDVLSEGMCMESISLQSLSTLLLCLFYKTNMHDIVAPSNGLSLRIRSWFSMNTSHCTKHRGPKVKQLLISQRYCRVLLFIYTFKKRLWQNQHDLTWDSVHFHI